jgi:two-component system, NarL family, response regulator NreC
MTTRVLLADDQTMLRDGLRALLQNEADLEVVGEASDGRTTVQLAQKLAPQVVVMDIGMPDLNGIEATRQIKAQAPEIKVVALSMHADKRFVAGMLEAGASAYLLKDCAFKELAHAIRVVMGNQTYLSPAIAGVVLQEIGRAHV